MGALVEDVSRTAPIKRNPLRDAVRTSRWSSPLSPIALRAALMRLVRVNSETTLPSAHGFDKLVLGHDAAAVGDGQASTSKT